MLDLPPVLATENVVFVTGAYRRTMTVSSLETFVETGVPKGLLADLLRFTGSQPKPIQGLLKAEIPLPVTLTSRLLNTRIGEAILERASAIVYPLRAPDAGVVALRSALVLGVYDNGGKLTPISFLKAYPAEDMAVNIPQLLAIVQKAASISDLVRFFSDAPLDGLR